MKSKNKISFLTKLLSNHYYLKEVPVDGKKSSRFFFFWGWHDLYASQIIRTGNCITLLSTPYSITLDSFWNINYFEDISRFIFWTFNKSFRLKLVSSIAALPLPVINHILSLLDTYPLPFNEVLNDDNDEELQWCYKKVGYLKKDERFKAIFQLDRENRAAIKEALERRLNPEATLNHSSITPEVTMPSTTFLEMLRPISGSPLETIKFISQKTEDAGFKYNLFRTAPKLTGNRNPYGFNGAAGAMIEFFREKKYFYETFTKEEIFKTYLDYTGNKMGKFSSFYANFNNDTSFEKHINMLKALGIAEFKG